MFNLPSLVLN
ncbi:hypothetical protein F383_12792 [Gossypium arboreum]|uniref:Uncharacterized protein n=1 Tax=Gossypium arboreum TaxID=29729 RepID=A0A0B0P8K1_GOSAR|nr:hypothetical protein F383_26068 [Gossypium arboreum]KHG28479.1 hypothetical protein F383_12792 [Gossypium arboreum]